MAIAYTRFRKVEFVSGFAAIRTVHFKIFSHMPLRLTQNNQKCK